MFERFTERARAVLAAAGHLAQDERSPAIRRHHLLICLADSALEGSQSVASVLADAGVDIGNLRAQALDSLRATETAGTAAQSSPGFTREAKKTLEISLREALSLGHNYIGREHLLLGILRDADGPLRTLLDGVSLRYDRAREVVAEQSPPSGRRGRRGGVRGFRPGRRTSDGLEAVLRRTFEPAPGRDATTGDLLLALLETPGTHFALALAGYQLPPVEAARLFVDKLIQDKVPDGIEGAVKVDPSGSVTVNDPRIADALKNLVGDGPVTPEKLQEILRRLKD